MHIEILGPGCKNCVTLERRATEALGDLGIDAEVTKVTDPVAIVAHGVMRTPALVIDGDVVISGRVPTVRDLRTLIAARVVAT